MRKMILSFSYEWYAQLKSGEKIYELRKRFCKEPVEAYIYIGLPYRQLVAVVELGKPENIEDWLEKYGYDEAAVERIKDYLTRNKVAMPIFSFQEIEPIDMRKMEKDISGFRVPISYMFLDDKPELLKYIDLRTKYKNKRIEHDFTHISSKDICVC